MIERIPGNKPYNWNELFTGDWNLFKEAVGNPESIFVYDIDGILANTAKRVFQDFTQKTGVYVNPVEITGWMHLTEVAKKNNLHNDQITGAENGWYDTDILRSAQRYLHIRSAVLKTIELVSCENNYVLTSRDPEYKQVTIEWINREFPELRSENVLIRSDRKTSSGIFKANYLSYLSTKAPWVIFIDDALKYVQAAIDVAIPNLVIINIPQGVEMPNFGHDNLILIKRYPEHIQAMYPLYDAIGRASKKY